MESLLQIITRRCMFEQQNRVDFKFRTKIEGFLKDYLEYENVNFYIFLFFFFKLASSKERDTYLFIFFFAYIKK